MPAFNDLYSIDRYIDTRALGFSARVAQAMHWASGQDVAFKVMRREHQSDERVWQQFVTEVDLLNRFRDTPAMAQMVDCGYVADPSRDCPTEGEIVSCGTDLPAFQKEGQGRMARHWRPYIALELLPADHCLLNLVHGVDGDGRRPLRLTTEDALSLAIQFAEFLCRAHAGNIVYWDHKPEHVYWMDGRLRIIDLNVSRPLGPETSSPAKAVAKGKDLQHMLSGVLYTAFTGRDFRFQDQAQAPQPTPSAPKMVEVRFNGTSALDFHVEETLLPAIDREINRFMAAKPSSINAEALLDCLRRIASEIGWEVGYPVTEQARQARSEIQKGLAALRQAQAEISKARQHFLQARAINPADRESERLHRESSEFYRQRVLP
jgi:serine/threonine protein kinase